MTTCSKHGKYGLSSCCWEVLVSCRGQKACAKCWKAEHAAPGHRVALLCRETEDFGPDKSRQKALASPALISAGDQQLRRQGLMAHGLAAAQELGEAWSCYHGSFYTDLQEAMHWLQLLQHESSLPPHHLRGQPILLQAGRAQQVLHMIVQVPLPGSSPSLDLLLMASLGSALPVSQQPAFGRGTDASLLAAGDVQAQIVFRHTL